MKTFHRPKFRPYRSTLPHRRDRGRYCFFSGTEHERRRMVCIGGNYDAVGHQTAFPLTLNGRSDRTISTEYDHLGNATSIRQHGNAVDEIFAEFEHNANGLLTSVRRYEKDDDTINEIANSLYEYNANSAVTSITHNDSNGSQIVKHSYTYDETNNIVEYLNSIDGNTEYNYDFLGQLISADYANGSIADETYTYDENGNRITANGSNYTTGDNNELTSDGTWTYTYDAEGNRISKTNATNRELYTWDYRNRLTTVTKQTYDTLTNEWTTVQIVEYSYDYNNVWIRKIIGENKTIFIPENYQTTVQIDNGTTTHHYLWTPNQQDKLLADTTSTEVLWSLTDHLGTIRDILGVTATHLIYDAFGNLTTGTNPILFGYTGKPFDPATNLQNNINRWYDATTGRWLAEDPISFSGTSNNLCVYVNNNPLSYLDKFGLINDKNIVEINGCWLTSLERVDDNVLRQIGRLLHGHAIIGAANKLSIDLMFAGVPLPKGFGQAVTASTFIEIVKSAMEKDVNKNNPNITESIVEILAKNTGNTVTKLESLKPIIEQFVRNTANFSQSECKLVSVSYYKEPSIRNNGEKVNCTLYYCAKTSIFLKWTESWTVTGTCNYSCTNAKPGGGRPCCQDLKLPTEVTTKNISASGTGVGGKCNVTRVY